MKIRNQLFLIFLILGVNATLIISFLIYTRGKQIILNQIFSSLESSTQTKKIRLQGIIKNKFEQLEIISQAPFIAEHLENYSKESKFPHRVLDSLLKRYMHSVPDFYRIHILNNQGIVINSTDTAFLGKDYSDSESFLIIKNKGKYLDHFFYNEDDELCLLGGVPIYYTKILGVLLVELKADDFIFLTSDYTGLGSTGETVLAKEYQQPILLTPTRFKPNAALHIRIPKGDSDYAINLALEGKEGIFENTLDYRGVKVIACTRFIEETGWGMLTKMDVAEAYDSIYILRNFLIILNLSFVIVAFIASYIVGRYLAKPLEELIESTNRIKNGDLQSRVGIKYNNELGILSESFNSMAEKLENKINELDKVAYVVSHDLKAPLNSIIPLSDFIKEDNKENLNEDSIKMLDMIKFKCLQMNELIKEILETARTEKRVKEHVDVDSLVSTIISNLNPPSNIQIFIQHNLPLVHFHKISLMQVFQNLIHNALKYMDKEQGTINIGYLDKKGEYKFWITDNGPGIKDEDQERIFGMYETANQNIAVESTGIGLGVAKKIIEDNGGKIWVNSKKGKGSTFYFTVNKN